MVAVLLANALAGRLHASIYDSIAKRKRLLFSFSSDNDCQIFRNFSLALKFPATAAEIREFLSQNSREIDPAPICDSDGTLIGVVKTENLRLVEEDLSFSAIDKNFFMLPDSIENRKICQIFDEIPTLRFICLVKNAQFSGFVTRSQAPEHLANQSESDITIENGYSLINKHDENA